MKFTKVHYCKQIPKAPIAAWGVGAFDDPEEVEQILDGIT